MVVVALEINSIHLTRNSKEMQYNKVQVFCKTINVGIDKFPTLKYEAILFCASEMVQLLVQRAIYQIKVPVVQNRRNSSTKWHSREFIVSVARYIYRLLKLLLYAKLF